MSENVCQKCNKPTHDGDCQGDAAWEMAAKFMAAHYNDAFNCDETPESFAASWPDEVAQLTRHLRAFAKQERMREDSRLWDLGAMPEQALAYRDKLRALEDAARAVVKDYKKQLAIYDADAMAWVKRRLLDALAAALGREGTA